MGGNSEGIGNITTCAEFNFHADPEAAFVVLQRCNSSIQLVTWETCRYGNYVDWVRNNIICHNCQFLIWGACTYNVSTKGGGGSRGC